MTKLRTVTTKVGDNGYSSLFSGEKVLKNAPRLEAYGDLDELTSILGIARHQVKTPQLAKMILTIQRDLYRIAAELATTEKKLAQLKERVDETFLKELEFLRAELESSVSIPEDFIVPANSLAAAYLDHARAVSRRCERRAVTLFQQKDITNSVVIIWINRLSDILYLMARLEEGTPLYVKESRQSKSAA